MKNVKIFAILSGITALLFGASVKSADPFAAKLEKSIKVGTEMYLAGSECQGGGTKPPDEKRVA